MIPHSRPTITERDLEAVRQTLAGRMIAEGELTKRLEREFCDRFSAKFALATGTGSQALLLALRALGIGPADEVVIPTYVCPEVAAVLATLGARAILADIEHDFMISVATIDAAITRQTKAIIVPFAMGIWKDLGELRQRGI